MLEQVEIPGTREKAGEVAEVVNLSALKKGMAELERLYVEKQAAAADFAFCVKSLAKTSGLKPSVVKKVVKAKCDSRLDEERHEAEQLSMAFEEVGGC